MRVCVLNKHEHACILTEGSGQESNKLGLTGIPILNKLFLPLLDLRRLNDHVNTFGGCQRTNFGIENGHEW